MACNCPFLHRFCNDLPCRYRSCFSIGVAGFVAVYDCLCNDYYNGMGGLLGTIQLGMFAFDWGCDFPLIEYINAAINCEYDRIQ